MLPALQIAGEYKYDVQKELEDIWIVDTLEELEILLAEAYRQAKRKNILSFDTETSGVNPKEESPAGKGYIVTAQLAWIEEAPDLELKELCRRILAEEVDMTKAWIDCRDPRMLHRLQEWLEDEDCPIVMQGGAYDRHVAANHGIYIKGCAADTLGMSRLQYPERMSHSLDGAQGLVKKILGKDRYTTKQALGTHKISTSTGKTLQGVEFLDMRVYVDDEEMRPYQQVYSVNDVDDCICLKYILELKLREMEWDDDPRGLWGFWEDHLCRYGTILFDIERQGICIDEGVLQYLLTEYRKLERSLTEEAYEIIGVPINLNSYQHKGWMLYGKGNREFLRNSKKKSDGMFLLEGWELPCRELLEDGEDPWVKKKKWDGSTSSGYPSTDGDHLEWTLERIEHDSDEAQCIRLLKARQEVQKLISATLEPMERNLRERQQTGVREAAVSPELWRHIHGTFSVAARTGRLSSSKPNLQQIPSRTKLGKAIRHAFICEPEQALLVADYSQLELNILSLYIAEISGGRDMSYAQALRDGDIHQKVADSLGISRRDAKPISFGPIYGMTAYKLRRTMQKTLEEAQEILDNYFADWPGVEKYMDWAVRYAHKHGTARTILGRYRQLPNIHDVYRGGRAQGRPTRAARADERRAMNTPIQGSAQDIVGTGQIHLADDEELREYGYKQRLVVHDEVVGTCIAKYREQALKRKVYLMENAITWPEYNGVVRTPVEGFSGANWGEGKDGLLFSCPRCEGTGKRGGDKCSHCGGEGAVSTKQAAKTDWRQQRRIAA